MGRRHHHLTSARCVLIPRRAAGGTSTTDSDAARCKRTASRAELLHEGYDMKHSFSTSVTKRDHNNRGIEWTAKCGRHATWTGSSYEQVEDSWRQHVYDATGDAPDPMGDKSNRWMPSEVSA